MGIEVLYGVCCNCGATFAACPNCVNSLSIDPETGLPPDVTADGKPQEPTEEAVARSRKQPLCDECISKRNQHYPSMYVATSQERHIRGFCGAGEE